MASFRLLSWNIAGILWSVTSVPFSRARAYVETTDADVVCLQELYNAHDRLGRLDLFREQSIAVSPDHIGRWGDVHNTAIITRFDLKDSGCFVVDGSDSGSVTWASLKVEDNVVNVYNCRLGLRNVGIVGRLRMIHEVFDHAEERDGGVIVCGDMNTTIPAAGFKRSLVQWFHRTPRSTLVVDGVYREEDERYVFEEEVAERGFSPVFDVDTSTWCLPHTGIEWPDLKLDWLLTDGIDVSGKELGPYVSDHRPLHVQCHVEPTM